MMGDIEINILGSRHGQQVSNLLLTTSESLIFLDAQQDVRRSASISNENGAVLRGLLGASYILVQLSTG